MAKFHQVEQQINFIDLEKKLVRWWYESGLVNKYLQKNNSSDRYFSFLDGPITANNPMGVHHAWGRTYKDIWQRFKNMQGFRQRFQNGFDCQGLWVEVQVEKELGFKSKKDIENLVPGDTKESIAKFVQLCKNRVNQFSEVQAEQSRRLGYFMDWDNSYFTLSNENNYMIWTFLKECFERGLIYKGHDSVPWCPRCGTAISQHEMLTENYAEVTHESIFVQYPIIGRENEYLLVWTTTPWTLPANVAIAVDAQKEYVGASGEVAGNIYYLLRSAAEKLSLKVERVVNGSELVGLKYSSAFDKLPRVKEAMSGKNHEVVATDTLILPISEEEGTGLVHLAPGAGTEDFQLGKKYDLAVIDVIDEEANYLSGMDEFSGQNAKDKPELIFKYLKMVDEGRYFFKILKYKHKYPACWRCQSELVWRVVDEWYISMDQLREPMKAIVKKIQWIPEFGLKRELDWLDNMHDWLISKKRYWGLALPIWECKNCGDFQVIGSEKELKEKAIEGWEEFEGNSPHRPYIDEIKIKCDKCSGLAERIPDVGNPWLDAGIVPFSTVKKNNQGEPMYWTDKSNWEKWFPADFITESFPGQFKNWFYSLIAMSTVLENREPFKAVLGFATLLAEDGRPMHKSWGNSIEFNEGSDKIGVDVMRWIYARQDPAQNLLFGYKAGEQMKRQFHLMLWNIYNFFVTYATIDDWNYEKDSQSVENVLDKWINIRLKDTGQKVTNALERFDARSATLAIEEFVQDFSLWYVRRSRDRVGPNVENLADKEACYSTLYKVLITLSSLLAPFMPFMSEEIYKNLTGEESVHLTDWYEFEELSVEDEKLIGEMQLIRKVVERGHAARKELDLPVRQPLASINVQADAEIPSEVLLQLIKDELNIKNIEWIKSATLEPKIRLETKLTLELEEEGRAREVARSIQEERKKLGTPLDAKVKVTVTWLPQNEDVLSWLMKRTLAQEITLGKELKVEQVS